MKEQLAFDLMPSVAAAPMPAADQSNPGTKTREISHLGQRIRFDVRRSRRRSIGLVIGDTGLRVSAPSWVPLREIDAAVIEKFDWIQRKLQAVHIRQQNLSLAESNWRSGGHLPYLGCKLALLCAAAPEPSARGQVWFEGDCQAPAAGQRLWLPLPEDADSTRIRDMAQGWLQQQAKTWFAARFAYFEAQTGLKPTQWRLSSATTRWGACNSDGRITLNWRLIHFGRDVIDYVMAHELAHLKELNHSAAFWRTLQSIYPEYLSGHQALKGVSPGDMPAL